MENKTLLNLWTKLCMRKKTIHVCLITVSVDGFPHVYTHHDKEMLAKVYRHLLEEGATKEEIDSIMKEYRKNNIENILSLRGDFPKDMLEIDKHNGAFKYASDLTAYLKTNEFCVAGAYYPETHIENNDLMDLFNLKKKVDSGTDFLISKIFFDNEILYKFKEKTEKLGINIPFSAGVIPVTNAKQIKRITSLCNCSLPPKFQRILDKYEDKPEALTEAGIAYAIEQIIDLI